MSKQRVAIMAVWAGVLCVNRWASGVESPWVTMAVVPEEAPECPVVELDGIYERLDSLDAHLDRHYDLFMQELSR